MHGKGLVLKYNEKGSEKTLRNSKTRRCGNIRQVGQKPKMNILDEGFGCGHIFANPAENVFLICVD
jgi:hypothetical protein